MNSRVTIDFGMLRNWAWLTIAVAGVCSAVATGSVWIANANEDHRSGRTAEEAVIEIRKEREASERVLRALCINPNFVKSVECTKLRLRDKEHNE